MESYPLMPRNASAPFAVSVAGCFFFWLIAYGLIIRRGFKDKTFGMPIAALCGNVAWETLFSNCYLPDYFLVRLGNSLWVGFDLLILYTAFRYGPDDFSEPLLKRSLRALIVIGLACAFLLATPFAKVYQDTQGYLLGWIAAFIMSILFPAMLIRRNSSKGQSFYIAVCMLLGNFSAYLWVKFYPREVLAPIINLVFMIATGLFNLIYIVLIYQKHREENINPWTRF